MDPNDAYDRLRPALLDLARKAVAAQEARKGEDIDAWAARLAADSVAAGEAEFASKVSTACDECGWVHTGEHPPRERWRTWEQRAREAERVIAEMNVQRMGDAPVERRNAIPCTCEDPAHDGHENDCKYAAEMRLRTLRASTDNQCPFADGHDGHEDTCPLAVALPHERWLICMCSERRLERAALLDELVAVAIRENDRAVKQALRGEREPTTGALWETCFRQAFSQVLQRSGRTQHACTCTRLTTGQRIQGKECPIHLGTPSECAACGGRGTVSTENTAGDPEWGWCPQCAGKTDPLGQTVVKPKEK